MNHEFFLVALPGLEDLVLDELREWYPNVEATAEHGGVTVRAELSVGLSFNLCLKTPTRVLIRVKRFRCRDFPTLYKTILGIAWQDLVNPACELAVHAASRLSRLKIKRRIEETCSDAWIDYRSKQGLKARRGNKLDLYVRLVNDECTLSLDTSGERLHKRGTRERVGEAPLRETIAASLIQMTVKTAAEDKDQRPVEIFDPMVGSGTFLLEAFGQTRIIDTREFAFENFSQRPKALPVAPPERVRWSAFVGWDQDAKTLAAARENLKDIPECQLLRRDIFADGEPLTDGVRRWVFVNPPYGERLKVKEPLSTFYARLFASIARVAKPERVCVLLPAKAVKGKFALPPGWKVIVKRPFVNGGIPVVAFVFALQTEVR